MKDFKTQVCTNYSQSKKLMELGLKRETADFSDDGWNPPIVVFSTYVWTQTSKDYSPRWGLHRLLSMLPRSIEVDSCGHCIRLKINEEMHICYECNGSPCYDVQFTKPDLFDNMVDCIEWLINEGHFNKEYLNT